MTLEQYQALWRAFSKLKNGMAAPGNVRLLTHDDVPTLDRDLLNDPDWNPPVEDFHAAYDQTDQAGGQMFPASLFDTPKPRKPANRDLEARANRVVELLLQDPKLAVRVRNLLGAKKVAKPWKRNYPDVWAREVLGHEETACYMQNDGAPNNGGAGKPNWRMAIEERKGVYTTINHTDDVQAGKDALDFLLLNTGWVLL